MVVEAAGVVPRAPTEGRRSKPRRADDSTNERERVSGGWEKPFDSLPEVARSGRSPWRGLMSESNGARTARRLARSPVPLENFVFARVAAGNLGPVRAFQLRPKDLSRNGLEPSGSFQGRHVTANQRFFFASGPSLELPLARNGSAPRPKRLNISEPNRPSIDRVRTFGATLVVPHDPAREVIGMTDVKRVVDAPEDIQVVHLASVDGVGCEDLAGTPDCAQRIGLRPRSGHSP